MTPRTRIKICGLTRAEDVAAAAAAGADAVGFILYPKSPRYVGPERLAALVAAVPAFVTTVGLFVEPEASLVEKALAAAPLDLLQFHGNETEDECARYGRPWLKVARMAPGLDLVKFRDRYRGARALLLDTHVPEYGGSGKTFDWSIIPAELAPQVVLSGGLNALNVADAVRQVRPYAVDVASGVEAAPGRKDPARIAAFVAAVRAADAD